MINHAKAENDAFLFPINDPVFFMNSYPAEKGKNKNKIELSSLQSTQCEPKI